MKKLNVICGLPRSGSTLLCNILNQNPRVFASSTSILPQIVSNTINLLSNSAELKGGLIHNKELTEARIDNSLRAFCSSWYLHKQDFIIFDKSRGWSHNLLALRRIYPQSKAIVIVRDLRNVFASVEKQHQKNPLLDQAANPGEKTIYGRADNLFSPKGMIGGPIEGVEDIIRRKLPVMIIKYEQLCNFPNEVMAEVYQYLEEPLFIHDFNDVKNTATDVDGLYLNKFPHEGSGKVRPTNPNGWVDFLDEELADKIMVRFPLYNKFFGYD